MKEYSGPGTLSKLSSIIKSAINKVRTALANIENAMYQTGTYTTYTVTITPATAVTGPITEATVGAVLGDTVLAGLTPSGTDDAGNSLYDCVINGVTTGSYAKIDELSAVMAGINGSNAGVSVGYDQVENVFTFTAKLSGACVDIVFGDGLATALFDPPSGIDFGSKIFIDVYSGLGWLNDADDGTTVQVTFSTPDGEVDLPVRKTTTVSYVVSSLNAAFGGQMTTSCDKHTGEIIIKDGTGQRVDLSITDSGGDPITFKASSAPPNPYTYGKDAVFVAVKVNGVMQEISDKAVDIAVPTQVSQLVNDSGYQTQAQVSASIANAVPLPESGSELTYVRVTSTTQQTGNAIDCVVPAYVRKTAASSGNVMQLRLLSPAILPRSPSAVFARLYISIIGGKYQFRNDGDTASTKKTAVMVNSEGSGSTLSCYMLDVEILSLDESGTEGGKAGDAKIEVGASYNPCGSAGSIAYFNGNCVILPGFENRVELVT